MAIPREYATSNPLVRDELAKIPVPKGNKGGDFVAPDYPIDAETVDTVTQAEHALHLDDLRAEDTPAKTVRFETGTTGTISIVERALKARVGSRKVEEAESRGVNVIAERAALLRDDILDAKEYRIAQKAMTAANYAPTHKENATNLTTIDLLSKMEDINEVLVVDGNYPANRAVIGRRAWAYARTNTGFQKFVSGSNVQPGAKDLTLAMFAEYLGLDEVRMVDFRRRIGSATATPTQFWTTDSFLVFAQQDTLSNRTFMATPVCPYGPAQGSNGQLVDVRTDPLPGTDRLTEFGAYHRYLPIALNWSLAYLFTAVTKS